MKRSTRRSRRNRNPHSHEEKPKPFFSKANDTPVQAKEDPAFFQPKLTIGRPGDKYEREADDVADAVVNHPSGTPVVQEKARGIQKASSRMEEDREIQEKPVIQREGEKEEEAPEVSAQQEEEEMPAENVGAKEEEEEMPAVNAMEEEDKSGLAAQEEEEEMPAENVGAKEEEEEMPAVNAMEEEDKSGLAAQEEEEEMPAEGVGAKAEEEEKTASPGAIQTKAGSGRRPVNSAVSNRIKSSAGKGRPLPPKTRAAMEAAFGLSFKNVRIHTDSEAVELNKKLGAQAFTHRKDLYFNSGKFHPETNSGKELLAHELTHVVQQNNDLPPKGTVSHSRNPAVQLDDEKKTLDFEAIKKILEQIPTGKEALKRKEDLKVDVEFKSGGGSYHRNGKLVIDSFHTPERAALAFVHEMNHAYYYHKKLRVDIHGSTREEYVDGKVKEEAEGAVKSIEAKIELEGTTVKTEGLSYPLEKEYRDVYDKVIKEGKGDGKEEVDIGALKKKARAEGKKRVIKGFKDGEVVTSTTGEKYPDYYGAAWDKVHSEKK